MSEASERLWYYSKDGSQQGPVPNAEFMQLVSRGEVTAETLVWHGGMGAWQPYGKLADETAVAGATQASCHYCGKVFPAGDLIDFNGTRVCAACKPVFVQQFKENAEVAPPMTFRYAGFWIRAGAAMLDGILMNLIQYAIIFPLAFIVGLSQPEGAGTVLATVLTYVISIMVGFLYSVWPLVKYGATPGKMICGLKVIRSDGSDLTWGRAIGRYFGHLLSSMVMCIGYLMAAFDKVEHKALHDTICDTRVIYKNR